MENITTKPFIGKRIIAGLIDYSVIYGFLLIFMIFYGEPNESGGYSLSGILSLVPILFWAIMTVGIEQLMGATFGNILVDLKPISLVEKSNSNFKNSNFKPSFGQSFKRHLLDPIDMFLFGIVGILAIKNSDKNQRLGDMWAKTIVVKASEK